MPKGKPLPNMMNNEVVEVLYTCLAHTDNANIDYAAVAKDLGLKDRSTAKSRLARVMKAQQKGTNAASTGIGSAKWKVTKGKVKAGRKAQGYASRDGEVGGLDKGKKVKVEDGEDENDGDVSIKDESDSALDDGNDGNVDDLED